MLWCMAPRAEYPNVKQGVRIAADGPGEAALQLTGVVDAIGDDGGLELRCLDEIEATRLEPGMLVTLEYFRGGTVFRLVAPVVLVEPGTTEDGPASYPRLALGAPSDVTRIQRRRYKRALVAVPVTLVPVELPSAFDPGARASDKLLTQWARAVADSGYEGTSETLSGSGLRMRVDAPVRIGDTVFLQIELPDGPVRVVGEVVWAGSGYPLEAPGQALGLELTTLTDEQRSAILAFVEGKPSV
jgi:Tfp pilus assembly protein PilZ